LLSTLQYVGLSMLKFWNNFSYGSPLFLYPQLLMVTVFKGLVSSEAWTDWLLDPDSWYSWLLFLFFSVWDLCRCLYWITVEGRLYTVSFLIFLLCQILGPDSGWQPIPLTDVITSAAAKKAYRKATLCVHPDKLQQRGASIQHKYICEKVFDLLKVCLTCHLFHLFIFSCIHNLAVELFYIRYV
jgi:hypothetical protein